jgi:gamma-glutamylcyclotransferase
MNPIYYFGYGSNLWLDQMRRRCPGSEFVSVAVLSDWKWIICERGFANIIKSPGDIVYGFVYTLNPSDEKILDGFERAYQKYLLNIDLMENRASINGLVYVCDLLITEGIVKEEYIVRMNHAIKDAEEKGIPKEYVMKYLRPFIPLNDIAPVIVQEM